MNLSVYRILLNHVCAGIVLLALSGCGAPIPPTSGTLPIATKTVAIVSLLPDTLSRGHVGFTVFQNAFDVVPAEFDPNDYALKVMADDLATKYKVVIVNVNRTVIMAASKATPPNGWMGPLVPYVFTDTVIQKYLKQQIKPGSSDIIAVIDGSEPDSMPSLNNAGVGLFSRGTFGPMKTFDIFGLHAHFEIFDGNSFKEITTSEGSDTDFVQSQLHWTGESYDSLPASTKLTMANMEHQAIQSYVTAVLQATNLLN
jgi:hypothetical protein